VQINPFRPSPGHSATESQSFRCSETIFRRSAPCWGARTRYRRSCHKDVPPGSQSLSLRNFSWFIKGKTSFTLGLRCKKTSYFYGTRYILYPYFLNYFLIFFKVRIIGSTVVKTLDLFRFLIFYEIIYSETLKMFEDKKI